MNTAFPEEGTPVLFEDENPAAEAPLTPFGDERTEKEDVDEGKNLLASFLLLLPLLS